MEMTNQLHQATAILMDGLLRVEGYTTTSPHCPRPNSEVFRDCSGTIMHKSSEAAWNNWLASKVSYPVRDNGLITLITSIPVAFIELCSGVAIDSILHRIEILDGQAVLKGEPEQIDLINDLLEMWEAGKTYDEILSKYTITPKTK